MYAEYAKDPRMKINVGIRRRLAPLLDNGRDEIELMHAILFRLPGSPVLYYGDEIAHGRQHLPRRPRRRAHADAVDRRPQRRLLPRRLRAALRAAADGPGLRLPGGQRRGAAAHADVAAALAAALHRAAQGAPGLRPGHLRAAAPRQPADLRPHAHATRTTSCCACTTSRARRRRSSSTCASSRGATRSRCSGARGSRASASCPTCSRSRPRGFFWFLLERGRRARPDRVDEPARGLGRRAALVRAPRPARSPRCDVLEAMPLRRRRSSVAIVEVALPRRARTSSTSCCPAATARMDALADRASVAGPHARRRDGRDGERCCASAASTIARPIGARAPDGRRAVELLGRASTTRSCSRSSAAWSRAINPELEMLRFLTERGFEHIAALGGWYEHSRAR